LNFAGELAHRGPDGAGLYRDGCFGMINTRLSIVDLAGGDQPISNEDGRLWVMQNGEIFNYPELRAELEARGHHFTTTCDTEVLVHAYEEWGEGCLKKLNGEFAFAVWDREKQELFLARDRFGIRPLFLADYAGSLVFGSEMKALLRHPHARRVLDPSALLEVFTCWAPAAERSLFAGIQELKPGHHVRLSRAGMGEQRAWWTLPFLTREPPREAREADLAEELRELLLDAVRLRLRADVPVGVYLSGGLDSSAVAASVRHVSDCHLRTFALRFEDPRFDEGEHQARMAAALETELSSVVIGAQHIAASFPEVIRYAEVPMVRTAPAPLFGLSRHVRESGFKVVLTGEGADEVFAGYDLFREDKLRRFWARQPSSRSRPLLFGRIYPFLAQSLGKTGAMGANFFAKDLQAVDHPLYSHRIRFANTSRILRLMNPVLVEAGLAEGTPEARLMASLPGDFMRATPLKRAQYLESRTLLAGYLLHAQGDRMLMGNAIEGRFPYLDHRLAEFAARVPDRLLLRGLREKHLLREAVAPLLPAPIANRQKHPYRAPILRAFVGPGAPEYVSELLADSRLREAGYFDAGAIERLVAKCASNWERGVSETDEMALVGALSTQLVHDQFVRSPRLAAPATPGREVSGTRIVSSHAGSSP
jgi:asparagine synthase (glutamine-hydrolysing)